MPKIVMCRDMVDNFLNEIKADQGKQVILTIYQFTDRCRKQNQIAHFFQSIIHNYINSAKNEICQRPLKSKANFEIYSHLRVLNLIITLPNRTAKL